MHPYLDQITTVVIGRALSVDKKRVDFGQLAVGSKAEVSRQKCMPNSDLRVTTVLCIALTDAGWANIQNFLTHAPFRSGSRVCRAHFFVYSYPCLPDNRLHQEQWRRADIGGGRGLEPRRPLPGACEFLNRYAAVESH